MTRQRSWFGIFGVVILAALLSSGCGGTSARHLDFSAGEYYSEEEYVALSRKDKGAYCKALDAELTMHQDAVAAKQKELTATRRQIESLRAQITPVEKELLRVESDIRTLTGQVAQFEALPREWTIKAGETLNIIASYEDIYANPWLWPRIFRANQDKILDPMFIDIGVVLTIPRDWPTEYTVGPDETLEMIAGYWEVYGDPDQWARLYEANKSKIQDPYNLVPKQVLVIPR